MKSQRYVSDELTHFAGSTLDRERQYEILISNVVRRNRLVVLGAGLRIGNDGRRKILIQYIVVGLSVPASIEFP